jgi:hypothetical protein
MNAHKFYMALGQSRLLSGHVYSRRCTPLFYTMKALVIDSYSLSFSRQLYNAYNGSLYGLSYLSFDSLLHRRVFTSANLPFHLDCSKS